MLKQSCSEGVTVYQTLHQHKSLSSLAEVTDQKEMVRQKGVLQNYSKIATKKKLFFKKSDKRIETSLTSKNKAEKGSQGLEGNKHQGK